MTNDVKMEEIANFIAEEVYRNLFNDCMAGMKHNSLRCG